MTISYSDDLWSIMGRWKGSVWKAIWKEALAWLSLYYLIRVLIIVTMDDDQLEHMKKIIKIFDSFTGKIPLQFLLGFYVGQVVSRWWAQVQTVPWPDEAMVWVNAVFYKDDNSTREKRRIIARYLILCETFVLRNVSTRIRKRFPNVTSLVQAGLITQDEYELYMTVNVENTRWQLPLQWIINGIIVPAVNDNEITPSQAGSVISKVNDFRTALRMIYLYDWVCIPLVYTQTCSVVVYGYFAFCLIGHQYFGQDADLYIPFLTVIQFIFFVGWFKVAQDLMRPFGEDDDDMELNVVLDRHVAVAMSFADELCTLMPTFSWDSKPTSGHLVNGYLHSDSISFIDGADDDEEETVRNDGGPFLLPYSKAALKSIKHDHAPKLHALVKIKSPEEAELIETRTWIKVHYAENGKVPNGTTFVDKEDRKHRKVEKAVKEMNPF